MSSSARAGVAATAIKEGKSDTLVAGIRSASVIDGTAYRGMFVKLSEDAGNPMNWKAGSDVQIMPSSFSTDLNVSKAFATGENQGLHGDKAYTQVMIRVEGGIQGVRVDDYTSWDKIYKGSLEGNPYAGGSSEREVISGGSFRVKSIEDTKGYPLSSPLANQVGVVYNSLRVITVTQTGVF